MRQPMFSHNVSFWFMLDACKWKLLPHQMHPPKWAPFTPLPASVANLIVCQWLNLTWDVRYLCPGSTSHQFWTLKWWNLMNELVCNSVLLTEVMYNVPVV